MDTRAPVTSTRPARRRPRRGVAMALVLLVIAITVVLGLCFLSASSSTTPAAELVDERLQARLVAESGLASTLTRLRRDASWRATATPGTWFQNAALAGGTFTVQLFDGEDGDGDGVIEGTNNFADDPFAPVTVRVVGASGEARHAVSAVYRPNQEGTLAVASRLLLGGQATIDSYNSQQGPYGVAGNVGSSARASSNRLGGPNIRLLDTSVLNANVYFPRTADTGLAYSIAPTAQMTGLTGRLAADEWSIAPIVAPGYTTSVADSTWASNTAVELTSDVVCRNFTLTGSTKLRVVGNRRIICDGAFTVSGSAELLLDNPKYGNLASTLLETNANNKKQLATRFQIPDTVEVRTLAARIRKTGKQVRLGLYSDVGGKPDKLLVQTTPEDITSDTFYWHESTVTPTTITPGFYWISIALDTGAPWYSYTALGTSVSKPHDAIAGGFLGTWGTAEAWEFEATSMNVYLTGNSLGKGATLDVYTNRKGYLYNTAIVNQNTQQPARLRWYHRSGAADSELLFNGSTVAYASFVIPDGGLRLAQQAQAFGTVKARDVFLLDTAVLRGDASGGTADPGIVLGERLEMSQGSRLMGIGGGQAVVASCEAGSSVIRLKGTSQLKGDAYAGPGAAGAFHVIVEPTATLTGARRALSAPVGMTTTPVPSGYTSLGAVSVTAGTYVLNANREATSLTVGNAGKVEVRGDVTLVVRGPVTFANASSLVLAADSRLTLHVVGPFVLRDDAMINENGAPGGVTIYGAEDDFDLMGRSRLYGAVHAPSALVRMQHYAEAFGNVVGRRVVMNDRTKVHYDRRPSRLRWSEEW